MFMRFKAATVLLFIVGITNSYCDYKDKPKPCPNPQMCDVCKESSAKFYVGITGGLAPLAGHYQAVNSNTTDTHFATIGSTQGLVGGVVGAQTVFLNHGFFAVQANGFYNTTNKKIRSSTNTVGVISHGVNTENHCQWGADARLGFRIFKTNTYALGGFEYGNWKMTLNNASATSVRGIPAYSIVTISKALWGGKAGGGITFPFIEHVWANMEYSYTWFGTISQPLTDNLTGQVWHHQEVIRQNSILFGLNFMF